MRPHVRDRNMNPSKAFFKIIILGLFFNSSSVLAVELQVTDIFGKQYQLNHFKGKWLIINYWATWCPPCRDEIPMLVDYDNEHENVKVFGINYEPGIDIEDLKEFVDTYFVSYPNIVATPEIIKKFGNPLGLPMTVFVGPDGKIIKRYTGKLNEALLNRITQKGNM